MSDFTKDLKPASPDGATVLARERAGSSIPVDELSTHLLTTEFLDRQNKILKVLLQDPLFSKATQANLSRPDRYRLGLARGKRLKQLVNKYGWDEEDYKMAAYLVDDVSPFHLHTSMFITTVREQANDTQRKYWLPKIEAWKVIGAYAQTELGHGSNVRGLECEARWDPTAKEFIIHSPTLTASKWWNGTLGRTANHAIVVAQLLIPESGEGGATKYKNHGPHPFIVQVRDMVTHQPPKSIVVGDIGPKYGYAPMDNAYMLFNQHRVPYEAMLSRYSSIDLSTNAYIKPANPNVVYGTMTYVRSNIVMHARLVLARAVTVAVRYLSIRRQFKDRDSPNAVLETAVLDYPTVQIRVLPLLATAFALHYSGKAMGELYWRTRQNIERDGDFAALAELHSTSSGLKSLCTTLAADGIETCRRAMGGHGFGGGSGLVQLNSDYLSKPTVEGDNWMITQQVAQYLIKKAKGLDQTPKSGSTKLEESLKNYFYTRDRTPCFDILSDDSAIVKAFEWRAAHLTFLAHSARETQHKPWNTLLIQFHKLSKAHSQSILTQNFHAALAAESLAPTTHAVLTDLFRLFALYTIDTESREFFTSGAVSNDALDRIPDRILDLMARIRPHAVKLVDAWGVPDYLLDSALGRFDGKVYEDLFHRAHVLNPLNKITFNPRFDEDEIELGSGDQGRILAKL